MTWDEYKKILFSIRDSDIFIEQKDKKLPVNTQPSRDLYKKIVEESLGYRTIGDLPYTTQFLLQT